MRKKIVNKGLIIGVIIIFIGASFIGSASKSTIKDQEANYMVNEGTEYWALLVAVGVYADFPEQNRPLMLEEVDDLYDVLLQSDVWSEDHIKVIKAEDATVSNIISGLKWLDDMEDEDDFSLIFITTHGAPLGFDIPPFDEEDKTDEILASYWQFAYGSQFLYDDQLNYRLNRLESQGVCFIVDSCYAGGFNDPPNWLPKFINPFSRKDIKMSSTEWMEGFAEDVRGQSRVILMASREDELSYSGGFAPYLIDGLRGFADDNDDGIVSAEEAFFYSEPRTSRQNPTIYDGYDGELPLIYLTESAKKSDNEQKIVTDQNSKSTLSIGNSPENSVINGFVKDAETADPLEDALVNIRGFDNEWEFFENETTTDSSGFYYINVPACRCWITVYADGYCNEGTGGRQIGENEILWVNFSMYPRPPETSVVCGYITDEETSDPINGANVTLFWEGDQEQSYTNVTNSDHIGFYFMNVAAGQIDLEVEAKGYFLKDLEEIIISDYETLWVNFSLTPRPAENSIICGYITDEETGDSIKSARVIIEWIDVSLGHEYHNETYTDSSGFYFINVAAGEIYHDIHEQGYEYYNPYRWDTVENKKLWMNISLEEEAIEVDIAKPLRAFYINNNRLMPYNKVRIIGSIDIEAYIYKDWWGGGSAEKVEFYIDGNLKATLDSEPYIWTWSEKKFGKHTIKVIAYDDEGNSNFKEIEVNKFL